MTDPTPPVPPRGRIRVLLVGGEGSANEVPAELSRGGYDPDVTRAGSEDALETALAGLPFDVAICSDGLASFGPPLALRQIKRSRPELPVIVVSGMFGESIAGAAMKAGASDFIGEGYLSRLVPAVERELGASRIRRGWEEAAQTLRESEARSNAFMENSPAVAYLKDEDGRFVYVNRRWEEVFGMRLEEIRGKTDADVFSPEMAARIRANDEAVLASNLPTQ